ncbi:MAG: c-type cytochrome [Pseudomonadales bacterium]
MRKPAATLIALLVAATGTAPAIAAQPENVRDIVPAPEPFRYCVVCHGVELMGNRAVDAPRLAGLPDWYLARQMAGFRQGWRGVHSGDLNGMEMRPQATVLSERQVAEAVSYAASVPADAGAPPAVTVSGDAARGRQLYAPCAVCHGERGEGNQSLQSPPLAGQSDWYLITQLQNFRAGIRGSAPGDTQGALMRASVTTLTDHAAVTDVVAYINSLSQTDAGDTDMHKTLAAATLTAAIGLGASAAADVIRHPIPGSDFPIAQAVEVTAGTTLVFHSGTTPGAANPDAERFSPEWWGDTEAQTMSVFGRLEQSLAAKGLGFGDVVKMQVYLVGVPEKNGAMDFDGFMTAYRRYFGTEEQPNLPARSTFQVAGLAAPGMLVEIEVVLARPAE